MALNIGNSMIATVFQTQHQHECTLTLFIINMHGTTIIV